MSHTASTADMRKSLMPLRLFSLPETGAGPLHVARHLYHYASINVRDEARAKALGVPAWKEGVIAGRHHIAEQHSRLYSEAPSDVLVAGKALGGTWDGNGLADSSDTIYEYRRYQLKLGYDTVPRFYKLYGNSISSKVANQDEQTSLATVMHTEIGEMNQVIEIWRHGGGLAGMERSRILAREADAWKSSIAKIAELAMSFENTVDKPTAFSVWR